MLNTIFLRLRFKLREEPLSGLQPNELILQVRLILIGSYLYSSPYLKESLSYVKVRTDG